MRQSIDFGRIVRSARISAMTAAGLALSACGSTNTVSTRTQPASTSIPYVTQVNDALDNIFLKAKDVRLVRTPGGVLKTQIDVANDGFSTRSFAYQAEWLDANGTVVESVMNNWSQAQVYSGSTTTLTVVAPTPECTDFRLKVRAID